jgi:FdhD protein
MINLKSDVRKIVKEPVALEAPVNLFVNNNYVITLLATPQFQQELALGWLFNEGVLQSYDEVEKVVVNEDNVNVTTRHPIKDELLRVVSVSRLLTTACGLSASKFFETIKGTNGLNVTSNYKIAAEDILDMTQKLDEGTVYKLTGGVHVAALFEEGRFVAIAEDVGRHNTIDKVIGIGIQATVNFSHSVLVSSGRQPADMVLKAARANIPIIVSIAGPIRSGIIAAKNTGVTLVCFARNHQLKIYTFPDRIII